MCIRDRSNGNSYPLHIFSDGSNLPSDTFSGFIIHVNPDKLGFPVVHRVSPFVGIFSPTLIICRGFLRSLISGSKCGSDSFICCYKRRVHSFILFFHQSFYVLPERNLCHSTLTSWVLGLLIERI